MFNIKEKVMGLLSKDEGMTGNMPIQMSRTDLKIATVTVVTLGIIVGRVTQQPIVTTKTEYVDKVKIQYINKTESTSNQSIRESVATKETKNNITTTVKIKKTDGTVIETTVVDLSSHLGQSMSSLTDSLISTKSDTAIDSTMEHSESTVKITEPSSASKSIFALGLSYKDITSRDLPGMNRLGVSGEMKVWRLGVQAQAFGDGSVQGTVKWWF